MAIQIEIDGKKVDTNRDVIKEMLDQGIVTSKTPIWISGSRSTVGSLVDGPFISFLKKCFGFWLESKNSEGKQDPRVACCGCMVIGLGTLVFLFVLINISVTPQEREEIRKDAAVRSQEKEAKKAAREAKARGEDAFYTACQFVERALKNPKSAKFCSFREAIVSPGSNNEYTVGGWVDAPNIFGATVRTNWSITIRLDGTTWRHVYGPVFAD